MKSLFPPLFLSLAIALLLAGCGSPRMVTVDALRAEQPLPGRSFELVSDLPEISPGDLFYQEVASRVTAALTKAGFQPAANPDLTIGMEAYLSDPLTESRSRTEPIYTETMGSTTVIATPVLDAKGNVVRFVYTSAWSPPRTELAGYTRTNEQITVYDKILHLSARQQGDSDELWTVTARLRDPSTDFRSALPILLKAAQPYFGQRTEGEIRITIDTNSDEFNAYRQSLSHN